MLQTLCRDTKKASLSFWNRDARGSDLPNDYSSFSRAFIERLIRLRPISTSMTLTLTG